MECPDELLKTLTEAENEQRQADQRQTKKDYEQGVKRLGEIEILLSVFLKKMWREE